ncbi:hypothetical protein F4805DRAFT_233817 [Annulohypoxylon moriforme]|nr:hypothetical protein F4805DRAFT_233817 [Annulohypoxylon moriforme]
MAMDALEASMYFLEKAPKYETEKPYSLRFPPGENLAQSNILREEHLVRVDSMRGKDDLALETSGFEVMPFTSPLSYRDFDDVDKITGVLLPAFCEKLKEHLGAKEVVALDHAVRRRHENFPISIGKNYEYNQPTMMVHVGKSIITANCTSLGTESALDFSVDEGERMLRVMYPDQGEEIIKGGWKVVNIWRPLRGPLNDWPLAICDSRTVNHETDTMPGDIVFTKWATENLQVHHSDKQKWYYLPDQTADEVLIFKSAESSPDKCQAVPHGSFYNPHVSEEEPARESIDCRFFVLYAPLEQYPSVQGNVFNQRDH